MVYHQVKAQKYKGSTMAKVAKLRNDPRDVTVSVRVPWELLGDLRELSLRYGATSDLERLNTKAASMVLVDALCRELKARGYYGSGADYWYGSPMDVSEDGGLLS